MSNPLPSPSESSAQPLTQRKSFASKYAHKGWGIVLILIGALFIISGFSTIASNVGTAVTSLFLGVIGIVWGIYLLRGQGLSPTAIDKERRAEHERQQNEARQTAVALSSMQDAVAALAAAGHGAAAVVAYRNLTATANKYYPGTAQTEISNGVAASGVAGGALQSPAIGQLPTVDNQALEIYRDWIILGQEAHDVDATTRGEVHQDGSVHVTQQLVQTKNNGTQLVDQRHDTRTATVQLASSNWSLSVGIDPDGAAEARRIVSQLMAQVETLKPQGVSAADIQRMVDTILNNTGQPPAEKLQQLSNLRYDRLLSDEEFEQAKTKILGIR